MPVLHSLFTDLNQTFKIVVFMLLLFTIWRSPVTTVSLYCIIISRIFYLPAEILCSYFNNNSALCGSTMSVVEFPDLGVRVL